MPRPLAAIIAILLSIQIGCAGMSSAVVSGSMEALICGAAEYGEIENAVRKGGWAWVSVVLELAPCVAGAVEKIYTAASVASTGEAAPETTITRGLRQRMRAATALARVVVNSNGTTR